MKNLYFFLFIFVFFKSNARVIESTTILNSGVDQLDVTMKIDYTSNLLSVTLLGPADKWFGIALNTDRMVDGGYAIICNTKESSLPLEFILKGRTSPIKQTKQNLANRSNVVVNGRSKVFFTRLLKTADLQDFEIMANLLSLNMIYSIGQSKDYAYHFLRGSFVLNFSTPVGLSEETKLVFSTLDLFTNPVNNGTIVLNQAINTEYIILDIHGRTVQSGKINGASIPLEKNEKGTYFVQIILGNRSKNFSFMVE